MTINSFRYSFSTGHVFNENDDDGQQVGESWKNWFWNLIWPFGPHNGGANDSNQPDRPLLLVPGICGTMLNLREKENPDNTERVWVRLEDADRQFKKLWGKFNESSGCVELFDQTLEVYIPEKCGFGGLYPIDELDPFWLGLTPAMLYYYHDMIEKLVGEYNYEAGSTLFGFGYDFRQSNRNHVDDLIQLLKNIKANNGGKRIDLISHSMGGLVVRCLLAEHPDIFEEYIEQWIAIACPFEGAPGFVMNALVNGASFVTGWESYFFVKRETFLQMCIESPSMYEMLPEKWVGDEEQQEQVTPQVELWIKQKNGKPKYETYNLEQFQGLQAKVLDGNQVRLGSSTFHLSQNLSCWKYAEQTKKSWQLIKWPKSCKFYNIYGVGFDTAMQPSFGSREDPLDNYGDVRNANVCFQTSVDGDGTVPAASSSADGLPAVERKAFKGLHRGLLYQSDVFTQIVEWLNLGCTKTNQKTYQSEDGWILI